MLFRFIRIEVGTFDEFALELFAFEMYNEIANSFSSIKRCMLCKLYGNKFAVLDGSPGKESTMKEKEKRFSVSFDHRRMFDKC